MKRKFSLFTIFFLSFFILFYPKAISEDRCGKLFSELKNNYEIYEPDLPPRYIYENFGFDLGSAWNLEKREWDFKKSDQGFFVVGKINDQNLIGAIKAGDEIISIKHGNNLLDLRDLGLDNDHTHFEDSYDIGDPVEFKFKRGNDKFDLNLVKKEFDIVEPFMDIYIISLEVNDKSNKFIVRLEVDSQHIFSEDDKIYELAMKKLYVGNREINDPDDFTYSCTYNVDEWSDENFAFPIFGDFLNVHSVNYNTFEDYVMIKPYSNLIQHHEDLGWENELTVNYNYTGNYEFNNKYDLRNFPFDKQIIKIHYVSAEDLDEKFLSISDYSQNMLLNFKQKESITGWNIINVSLNYEPHQDPISLNYSDGVSIKLELERKYGYYIYKVILPIILILMICWSSLWIPNKELESKLTITIVCLLSLIAYNFVIDKDLPKLEYLTILDWVILVSYFYATIPNFLAVLFFRLNKKQSKLELNFYEKISKQFGALSYIAIVLTIIFYHAQFNVSSAASIISWMNFG